MAFRPLIALAFLTLLSACSGDADDPEQALRSLIGSGEQAVESRALSDAMALVDQAYTDNHGNDWSRLRGLLAGYFLRHPSIAIIAKIDHIQLVDDGRAEVLLYAGLAGSAAEATEPLAGWRANLLRFELSFHLNEDEEWQLIHAVWRQARREDFIQ